MPRSGVFLAGSSIWLEWSVIARGHGSRSGQTLRWHPFETMARGHRSRPWLEAMAPLPTLLDANDGRGQATWRLNVFGHRWPDLENDAGGRGRRPWTRNPMLNLDVGAKEKKTNPEGWLGPITTDVGRGPPSSMVASFVCPWLTRHLIHGREFWWQAPNLIHGQTMSTMEASLLHWSCKPPLSVATNGVASAAPWASKRSHLVSHGQANLADMDDGEREQRKLELGWQRTRDGRGRRDKLVSFFFLF